MMPSRGVLLARRFAQRSSHRTFSPRIIPSSRPISARFASTSSTPTPSNTSNVNIDTITFDNVDPAAVSNTAVEGAGYLSSLSPSLDYGWGPTSVLEWTVEQLHFSMGVPWWGAIVATALLCRLATFPFMLKSQDQSARQAALASTLKPLMERIQNAPANSLEKQTAAKEYWQMRRNMGLSFSAMFVPLIAQGVVGFCGFRLTRAMANLPVPGFEHGGFLWLQDLTLSDPYLILPITMGLTTHLLFRLGGESGNVAAQAPGMRTMMLWVVPISFVVIGGFQPGATAVWFAATSFFGMGQTMLMQNDRTRKLLGVAPIYRRPGSEPAVSFASILKQMSGSPEPASAQRRNAYASTKPQYQSPSGGSGRVIDVKPVERTATSFVKDLASGIKRGTQRPDPRQRAQESYEKRSGGKR